MDSAIVAAVISAGATIVAAILAKNYADGRKSDSQLTPTHRTPVLARRPDEPPIQGGGIPPSPRLTVHGEVIQTLGKDLGVRVENAAEMREFWGAYSIDTRLDWFGPGPPVVSIGRKRDIEACKPGDRVSLTFAVVGRPNGKRGIKTVDFEVQS